MSEFKVGEIAIYVRPNSPHFGKEVTITKPLHHKEYAPFILDSVTGHPVSEATVYSIIGLGRHPYTGSDIWGALPEWLKKKQHKRDIDQIVSWSDCLWKPHGVSV